MSETKALVEGNEIQQTDLSAIKERRNPLTTSRMVNLLLTLLFGVSIVFHIVCLVVMVAKHNELVDKWDPDDVDDDNDEWCILFMDYDDSQAQPTLKFKNNKCHVVIYGSGALAGCAFLMIIFLLFKTAIFRSSGLSSLLDGVEIVTTGIFALVIAVIITLGKNETCDSLEEPYKKAGFSKSCGDIYLGPYRGRYIQVYQALVTAELVVVMSCNERLKLLLAYSVSSTI
ncbi:uncharacterized protein [Dysidea avara]|uniref:uncharacterized protein isoform X2 n=1 Tax=Dysidea avara TaxID=196820 RepID=UPI003319E526